jgi:beta-lactamase regulating signal transducer with metallopeptidase domain
LTLDRANRAFSGFVAVCTAAAVLLAMATCTLIGILIYRLRQGGIGVLASNAPEVRSALLFLGLAAVGIVVGVWALRRQWVATDRLTERVKTLALPTGARVAAAAERTGLSGRIDVVASERPFSFTYGVVSPRVAVSHGLVELMSDDELDAVLEHERYHVRNGDPLKILITRTLRPALFLLPALKDLDARYVAGRELAADRLAVQRSGRQPLVGALAKVVNTPEWPDLQPAAAIGGGEHLDVRVSQLETGEEPGPAPISRLRLTLSTAGVTVMASSFGAAVVAFGGPAELARKLCGQP